MSICKKAAQGYAIFVYMHINKQGHHLMKPDDLWYLDCNSHSSTKILTLIFFGYQGDDGGPAESYVGYIVW
jgi:hypothetical protein